MEKRARIGQSLLIVQSTTGMYKKLNSLIRPAFQGRTCTSTERAACMAPSKLQIKMKMVRKRMKSLTCSWMRPMGNRSRHLLSTLIKLPLDHTRYKRFSSSIPRFSSTTTSGWTVVKLLQVRKDSWTRAQSRLIVIKKHLQESSLGKIRGVWTCSAPQLIKVNLNYPKRIATAKETQKTKLKNRL